MSENIQDTEITERLPHKDDEPFPPPPPPPPTALRELEGRELEGLAQDFGSAELDPEAQADAEYLRQLFHHVAARVCQVMPMSRERSVVLTNLQTASMWAVKGVSRRG